MKTFTQGLCMALFCFAALFLPAAVQGQSVLNPNDSVITYNSANPPTQPAWGTIGKWVRTKRLSWNTNNYKCYVYNTYPFRLRFPKSYNPNVNDGKVYPILVFMHGEGEGGGIYDNEYSLFHGGQVFDTAVTNGSFDGYVLVMQTPNGFWGEPVYTYITQVLDYMVANNKLDPFRINVNGLSAGGEGCWEFEFGHTTYTAGSVPMSYSQLNYVGDTSIVKWTPMHLVQGGKDGSPDPGTTQTVVNAINAAGGNLTYTVFPNDGHNTWDDTWRQSWFWPFLRSTYAANPWTLFGHNQFCSGIPINAKIGVAAGYQAYQWRRNDTLINGATSNSIVATQLGTYDCRIEKNNIWSDWSHVPVVVSIMPPTVSPNITIPPLTSNVIPALDTSKGALLLVPPGYATYQWQQLGGGGNIGSNDTLYTKTPGQYEVKVTQTFGCSSSWSNPYTVINANGPNGPSAPTSLTATTLSNTSLRLDWNVNPSQLHPQTGFEVYQGTQSGGPYKIVALLGAGAVHDTVSGLLPGAKYYYVLRAVNGNAGSPASNEASTATYSDTIPPTAPGNLTVANTTHSTVSLTWNASTDNVGVTSYDIYINGTKSYSTTGTSFTVNNLQYPTSYGLSVVARDFAGNKSAFSNQVATEPLAAGINVQYYLFTSTPTVLPNYNNMVAIQSGVSTTGVSASLLAPYKNVGALFQGWLHITTAGNYQFRTTSVDGSAVYLGALNSNTLAYNFGSTPLVNNDGVHSSKTVTSATVSLAVGIYPIAVAYFHGSSGTSSLSLLWTTPSSGTFATIPGSAFADVNVVQGSAPNAPSGLGATAQSFSSIGLNWTDNSSNETGFEIWRSADGVNYTTVGTAGPGSTGFTDNNLSSNAVYYYEIRAINQYGASAYTTPASATTQTLPAIPAAPSGFVSEGTSTTTTVSMSWTNNANNATSIQLYRSTVNDSTFLPLATLAPTATSYTDKGLFDNSVYYYKVRAVNAGGSSVFSNEDSAHTKDRLPVLAPIASPQYMRYGTTLTLNVAASDSDGAALNVQVTNLPTAFGVYTSTGNGTGKITFTPAQADQGVYNNITVTVTDPQGGQAVQTFSLTVNNDYPPVITRPVSNGTLNETSTSTKLLAATEQNPADVLNWSFTGLPGFVAITPSVTGDSLTLSLTPGYSDGGTYVVQAKVDNGNHLFDTVTFSITVNNVPLPTVNTYFHFDGVPGSNGATPWNNANTQPAQNVSFSNLKDQNGTNSGISLTILTPWQNISYGTGSNVLGQTTGNNSGVYPDSVLYSGYYTDGNAQNIKIAGLDTSTKYNFTFFGSRGSVNDDRTTIYSLSGTYVNQSVSLQCASNTANTVSINNVRPNADGTVTMTLAKGVNAAFGYLNALVITRQFNDHTAPAAPRNLTGTIVNGSELSLTWVAAAYNANSYQVYKATSPTGPYTLLNPGATNPTQASYVDTGLVQNGTYYYYATATNSYGVSPGSDTFMIAVPNLPPNITPVAPIMLGAGQTTVTNVTATDASDVITLTVTGLPNWAGFADNGNGTGVLTLSPTAANMGSYAGTLTATDNHGAISTTQLSITVTLANLRNVYIHFNDPTGGEPAAPAPWNNTNSAPNAGAGISHLVDDHGAATNFNVTLANAWTGSNNVGPNTGNNSGVYPDVVEQSFYYDNSGAARVINLTGLSPNAKYNVFFYAGRGGVTDNRITHYSIGSQSVALNAASNTQNTVQINGVSPDATGTISISCTADAGSPFTYINALQLQYSFDTSFSSPAPLTTAGPTTSTIKLTWANNAPAITTGFEIWRGNTPTGPFNLLTTVGNTVTTYTDGGLSTGSSFFYEVRAVAGSRKSAFSNIAGGSTVAYTVRIQCNDGVTLKAQGGTWNSTNTLPFSGFVLPNLVNTLGQPTGMNFAIIDNFQGFNSLGTSTGNNTGIFPDNVMQGFYYNDFAQTADLAITGLDYASTYNFNFFSSRQNPQTNVVSTYQIGNQIVTQDASNNTCCTVQIAGVRPDSTGTIYFSIYNTQGGRSYLNALTIDGVPDPIMNYGQTPVATQATNSAVDGTAARFSNDAGLTQAQLTTETRVGVFPDPFVDAVSLSLHLPTNVGKLLVTMVDARGRVLLRQELNNLPQGASVVPLGINGSHLPAGTYYLLLQGLPDGKPRSLLLLKMSK